MPEQQPDVSVVIVNWNTRQYLLDCIESLREQTARVSVEIIVVDNGSHDGSEEAVLDRYPDIKMIQNGANFGFARANNVGFAVARGRYVCLVNTDVIALDGVLDKLVERMDAALELGLLGPRTVTREGVLRQNCRRFPTLLNAASDYLMLKRVFRNTERFEGRTLSAESYTHNHAAQVLSGCFLMVRRSAMDQVGTLDEDFFFYGEDTDWCRRFHDAGWGIEYFADASAIHFGGGSTAAYPTAYYLTMEKADLRYWRKHHRSWEVATYRAIKIAYHFAYCVAWLPLRLIRRVRPSSLKLRGHATNLVWLVSGRSLA